MGGRKGVDESLPDLYIDLYKETLEVLTVGGGWLYAQWEGCVH